VFPSITKPLGLFKNLPRQHRAARDASIWLAILTAGPFGIFIAFKYYADWYDKKLLMEYYKDSIVYGETYGKGKYV
uniref:COXEG6 n=1 Tax=Euglena gracilis TaxID=3039 RepID=UPI002FE4FA87